MSVDLTPVLTFLQQSQAALGNAATALQAAVQAEQSEAQPVPQPTPAPQPAPALALSPAPAVQATPAEVAPNVKLARVWQWLGRNKLGVYCGVYTSSWRAAQFKEYAQRFRNMGADFLCVKFGEWGVEWYDGTVADIRAACFSAGMGMAPYYFCRPQTWQRDAAICIHLAQVCGGVILDCEEQFTYAGAALHNLVQTIRNAVPGACIIVSGYGDPVTAFSNGRGQGMWPFTSIMAADAYQPQLYFAVWSKYRQAGWQAALEWGLNQCGQEFTRAGLGLMFPIQPAIMTGINQDDYQPSAAFLKQWKASLVLWEARQVTPAIVAACKAGLN